MENEQIRPDIFSFSDHQSYLKAVFSFNKRQRRAFSFAFCSRKLGISESYLKNVFARRRHLNLNLVAKVARTFNLLKEEQGFLTLLVIRDQTEDPEIRNHFDSILQIIAIARNTVGPTKVIGISNNFLTIARS